MVRGILGFSFGFALVLNAILVAQRPFSKNVWRLFLFRARPLASPGGQPSRGAYKALPVLELKRVDHPSIDSQRDNYWGRASDRGADCDVVGALCRTDERSCLACTSNEDTEESGRTENRY